MLSQKSINALVIMMFGLFCGGSANLVAEEEEGRQYRRDMR